MTWFCGGHWSPSRQMRWGVRVFEELVLEGPFWMLGWGWGCPSLQLWKLRLREVQGRTWV